MTAEPSATSPLRETPLTSRHRNAGARLVPFAGYAMPVQYTDGILAEHAWTREHAGLFDVSHMGQAVLVGPDHITTAQALETITPAEIVGLEPGRQRYSLLLNEEGGIRDDAMVSRSADPAKDGELFLVVNAAMKEADFLHFETVLPEGVTLRREDDRALLALQGPAVASVAARLCPDLATMRFMDARLVEIGGIAVRASRSGYTGEDGFELSVAADRAGELWDHLVAEPEIRLIGLGARDSLRLEAGLPLYGHDLNQETSPVEAALSWSIGRRRKRDGGFPGAIRIGRELKERPLRRRVGLLIDDKVPAREGADILDAEGELVGKVTSGGFGPSVGRPVATGYVATDFAKPGTSLGISVRGRTLAAVVTPLPFVPHRYHR